MIDYTEENVRAFVDAPVFKAVSAAAKALNIPAYVVGGFVRDSFLGRSISKDIDFVTVGSGIELAKELARQAPDKAKVAVFKNFGTAQVKLFGYELEFVGARKESYNHDSRKPIVEDGTLEDDQNRRDFTINAMAISLNAEDFGTLIDPFNGLEDLRNSIIRTPLEPTITFSDDPLRMLRAARFAAQLNFEIVVEAMKAINKVKQRISIISSERMADELNKMLQTPTPSKAFAVLFKTELLHEFFRELTALQGVDEIEGQGHKDNFYHTLQVVDNISQNTDNLWLRWAALLHDIGKPVTKKFVKGIGWTFHGHEFVGSKMVPRIFKKLKLPLNDKMKYVQKMVRLSSRPIALIEEQVGDSAVRRLLLEAGDDIEDLMILCEADITTKNKKKKQAYLSNFKLVREKLEEVEEKDKMRNWQPPLDGQYIMDTLKLSPGREVGMIKQAIKEAILEGEIPNNQEAAHKYMIKKAGDLGLISE